MRACVLLFGHYRDIAEAIEVEGLPDDATVADVAKALEARDPRFAHVLDRARFAVGGTFAQADTPVAAGDEVALLPPMSGG